MFESMDASVDVLTGFRIPMPAGNLPECRILVGKKLQMPDAALKNVRRFLSLLGC